MFLLPRDPVCVSRSARRVSALAAATTCVAAGMLVAGSGSAVASAARPHDALGATRSVTAVTGGLLATGWAGDADSDGANSTVVAVMDGTHTLATTTTSVAMPAVTRKHGLGPTPGFALTVPVPSGNHTVCFVSRDVGSGMDKVMKCVATPLGRHLTPGALALHNPDGAVQHASASRSAVHFRGWASDPDYLARRSLVELYLDGTAVDTAPTTHLTGTRPTGAGRRSAFDFDVPVSTGAHIGCLWVVNVGLGANSLLGCQAVDTRAHESLTGAPSPTIGPKVAAQAKKHIGQRYVWGATGPKTFDCSGLVMYSYRKNGFTTPRVAADQFAAARLIPASHAQPGDLVFYHDTQGDVYHVGIYLSPAKTVAAIDTAEGVNYQSIWDPTTATYGSFTHT